MSEDELEIEAAVKRQQMYRETGYPRRGDGGHYDEYWMNMQEYDDIVTLSQAYLDLLPELATLRATIERLTASHNQKRGEG